MRRLKTRLIFPLLIWISADFVSSQKKPTPDIKVSQSFSGIEIDCPKSSPVTNPHGVNARSPLTLQYKDDFTGKYTCTGDNSTIFVKFRTCENCIELDISTVAVIVVGDLVATFLVGVAVYCINSIARTRSFPTDKKSSDKQHLIPNEKSNRGPSDTYQRLRPREKDEYDVVASRK